MYKIGCIQHCTWGLFTFGLLTLNLNSDKMFLYWQIVHKFNMFHSKSFLLIKGLSGNVSITKFEKYMVHLWAETGIESTDMYISKYLGYSGFMSHICVNHFKKNYQYWKYELCSKISIVYVKALFWMEALFRRLTIKSATFKQKQARKSSEDPQAAEYAQFEKVWAR